MWRRTERGGGLERRKERKMKYKRWGGQQAVNKLLCGETRLHPSAALQFLSWSMRDVFIFIPVTSLRFISIMCVCVFAPPNSVSGISKATREYLMVSSFSCFCFLFLGGDFRGRHRQPARLWGQITTTGTATDSRSFFRVLAQRS